MKLNYLAKLMKQPGVRVRWLTYVILATLVFCVSGCSKRYHELPAFASYPLYDAENNSVGRFKTSYLADQIHAYFRGNVSGPIAVVSFVDVDHLYGSSTFGRLLTEQLMSELSMRGYNVIELRQSSALQIAMGEGEFALSRELELMQQEQDVAGLVVGTYAVSPVRVYVNARIVDPSTALVISAGSVEMAKTRELAKLLRNNSFPTSLERIPVRHMSYREFPEPYYRSNPFRNHNSFHGMDMTDDELFENKPNAKAGEQTPPKPMLEPTT